MIHPDYTSHLSYMFLWCEFFAGWLQLWRALWYVSLGFNNVIWRHDLFGTVSNHDGHLFFCILMFFVLGEFVGEWSRITSSTYRSSSCFLNWMHIMSMQEKSVLFQLPPDKSTSCSSSFSRWWFQIFSIFTPIPGEMVQFDEHIFQMGWKSPTKKARHFYN